MAAKTELGLTATPGRRHSFSPKTAVIIVVFSIDEIFLDERLEIQPVVGERLEINIIRI